MKRSKTIDRDERLYKNYWLKYEGKMSKAAIGRVFRISRARVCQIIKEFEKKECK